MYGGVSGELFSRLMSTSCLLLFFMISLLLYDTAVVPAHGSYPRLPPLHHGGALSD